MDKMKKELTKSVKGRTMLRKDNRWERGNKRRKVIYHNIYFDSPTIENRKIINRIVQKHDYQPLDVRVIGGVYGYVISFRADRK